jgi:hypothetical protein
MYHTKRHVETGQVFAACRFVFRVTVTTELLSFCHTIYPQAGLKVGGGPHYYYKKNLWIR